MRGNNDSLELLDSFFKSLIIYIFNNYHMTEVLIYCNKGKKGDRLAVDLFKGSLHMNKTRSLHTEKL